MVRRITAEPKPHGLPMVGHKRSCSHRSGCAASREHCIFNEPLLIVEDVSHSSRETRLHALGHTDPGRLLHITLRRDGKLIRVISACHAPQGEVTL